jgi:molybdopterin synthase catalytic subunit
MSGFRLTEVALDPIALRNELGDPACGGFSSFEGWVRNHNDGHVVTRLEYQAYELLALREGARVVEEARHKFGVVQLLCVHRIGALAIGDTAVWVGAAAHHRDEAFRACRYVIDEVKHRVPIWKKEHYDNGDSGWVNCERCAAGGEPHSHQEHQHPPSR